MKFACLCLMFAGIMLMLTTSRKKVVEEGPVTYKVTGICTKSCRRCISYKDSIGMVQICTTEKNWSKEVWLTPGDMASLLVVVEYTPNWLFDWLEYIDLHDGSDRFVYGQIRYGKESITKIGSDHIRISLMVKP